MDEPIIRKAAQFPLRTLLGPGVSVNFSDCDRNVTFIPAHLTYLSQTARPARSDEVGARPAGSSAAGRDSLGAARPRAGGPIPSRRAQFVPARHDWFSEMMWLLARYDPADPNALVLAAKGGHNQEMHNQNDVGNFVVHVNGETLIPDVGRGRYTRAYFGPQRYSFFVNSSRGHSVPRPTARSSCPASNMPPSCSITAPTRPATR